MANEDTSLSLFSRLAAAHRRGVLLEAELEQLEQKNKDEDVQEILSQIRSDHIS